MCAARETELGDERMRRLFRSKGFTYRDQIVSEGCTIAEISHSEAGENLTGHDHPHPSEVEDAHSEHGDEADQHGGHGS
jgi:hypothetical protein